MLLGFLLRMHIRSMSYVRVSSENCRQIIQDPKRQKAGSRSTMLFAAVYLCPVATSSRALFIAAMIPGTWGLVQKRPQGESHHHILRAFSK